jgi:hypothetical protein
MVQMHITSESDLRDQLRGVARRNHRTLSAEARVAFERHIKVETTPRCEHDRALEGAERRSATRAA